METDDAENELLLSARHDDTDKLKELLEARDEGKIQLDIDCKGKNKANLGWSPLHLAAYFGNLSSVLLLLQHGADVNTVNNTGDTPLHRAAYTGRHEVVMLLLQQNADVEIINAEGQTAIQLARNAEIKKLLEAAVNVGQRKVEETFMKAARDGDTDKLATMLKSSGGPNVNCTDSFGNTALHTAAYRGKKEVAVLLLQYGIDTSIKNKKGQTALDMTRDPQMKQILDVKPMREIQKTAKRFEGVLLKKSKLFGWRLSWVVLERGVINFFNKRADSTAGGKRKMHYYLDNATVKLKPDVSHVFHIQFSSNSMITLAVKPSDKAQVKRKKWENALKEHIAYSTYYIHQGEAGVSDDEDDKFQEIVSLGSMQDALENAKATQQVLETQVDKVTTAIGNLGEERSSGKAVALLQTRVELSEIVETSRQMCTALTHCLHLFAQQDELRQQQMDQEVEKSRVLQEALHVLAHEHHELEQSIVGDHHSPPSMHDDESSEPDEFFDCDNEEDSSTDTSIYKSYKLDNGLEDKFTDSTESKGSSNHVTSVNGTTNTSANTSAHIERSMWGARSRLPVPQFSRNDFSIWSILKQCIGKELSKITMPVIFNEPTSFLQRIVEYMEYAKLLVKASQSDDPLERLEYVTAFAISATASNWERIGKPFNPLLGETYELNREDLGFRIVTEQVSHHPPISSFHASSDHYTFHGAIHPKLKFWGKSVEVTPKGIVTLELLKHGEVYTWQNVNCCVHNIIVGKLWIELYGAMEITNHKTKHKSVLNFKPSGWFGKDLHKVEGCIYDANKEKLRMFYGKWVEGLYSYDVDVWESYLKSKGFADTHSPKSEEEVPEKGSTCNLNLPNQKCLWLAHPRPEDSAKFYNFSLFAMMLNELEPGQEKILPPTDSRLRPDIRKLDDGDIDGAAIEKNRLEEKQRSARKERKKNKEEWNPRFFHLTTNPHTGKEDWLFTNKYWDQDWGDDPDIF